MNRRRTKRRTKREQNGYERKKRNRRSRGKEECIRWGGENW
jgi:hypothetical protein